MKLDSNWATFLLALFCAFSGWVLWWFERIQSDKRLSSQRAAEAAKKEYAAERDFMHLKNNLKQLGEGLANGFDNLEERFDESERRFDDIEKELLRLEAYLISKKSLAHYEQ